MANHWRVSFITRVCVGDSPPLRPVLIFGNAGTVHTIKHGAIRPGAGFQEPRFHQLRHGSFDFRQPGFEPLLEHPPLHNAFQGILRTRVFEQVLKDFSRR
jgi:hypothetical protein